MTLRFLTFDRSEDDAGICTLEAMASVGEPQWAVLRAEAGQLLAWAHSEFPGVRGPLDEAGDWDVDVQGMQETVQDLQLEFDAAMDQLQAHAQKVPYIRYTLTLTFSGTPEFEAGLRTRFPECFD